MTHISLAITLLLVSICSSSALYLNACQTRQRFEASGLWLGNDLRIITCIAWKASNYRTDYYSTRTGDGRWGLLGISDGTVMNSPLMTNSQRWCYQGNPSGRCGVQCENLQTSDAWDLSNCAWQIYQEWGNFTAFPAFVSNLHTCNVTFTLPTTCATPTPFY